MTTTAVLTQQVSATVRWYTACPQPNGLQASQEGLWVIDQKDHPLMVMLLVEGRALVLRRRHASSLRHQDPLTRHDDDRLGRGTRRFVGLV